MKREKTRTIRLIVILILILGVASSTGFRSSHSIAKLQPQIAQIAATSPEQSLSVIVQKSDSSDRVEKLTTALGGRVTRDLHIIHAFGAVLPASAALELAQSDSVRWVSLDTLVRVTGNKNPPAPTPTPTPIRTTSTASSIRTAISVSSQNGTVSGPLITYQNVYPYAVNADKAWNNPFGPLQGDGVTVAVLDSGVNVSHRDFSNPAGGRRVLASVVVNPASTNPTDLYGHGTHVAGIIAGNGAASNGAYVGVAPKANLVSVKVCDDNGNASTAEVIQGLQWVLDNASAYHIRVVNLSLNSDLEQSYNVDPLDAAVEILWMNQIVVVVASGNDGKNFLYPPANDPFVITVGALDDMRTQSLDDDVRPSFSSYGKTSDGYSKPDIVAPGVNLVAPLAGLNAAIMQQHADHLVLNNGENGSYFRMSGTSMAAPVVAGAAALILQQNPNLTPDQVKYRLVQSARDFKGKGTGSGGLDVFGAISSSSIQSANNNLVSSQLLWPGSQPVAWDSVSWKSVSWKNVPWTSVSWKSVSWKSDYWEP